MILWICLSKSCNRSIYVYIYSILGYIIGCTYLLFTTLTPLNYYFIVIPQFVNDDDWWRLVFTASFPLMRPKITNIMLLGTFKKPIIYWLNKRGNLSFRRDLLIQNSYVVRCSHPPDSDGIKVAPIWLPKWDL